MGLRLEAWELRKSSEFKMDRLRMVGGSGRMTDDQLIDWGLVHPAVTIHGTQPISAELDDADSPTFGITTRRLLP